MVEEFRGKAESGKRDGGNGDLITTESTGTNAENLQPATFNLQPATPMAVWLAHGENDEVFPANDARKVAEALRLAGAAVRLDVFPGRGHGFGEDQPLLAKMAAEFCARELGGTTTVPRNVRPSSWYFWLPASLFGGVFVVRLWRRAAGQGVLKPARWLRIGASISLIMATLVSAAHLALPLFHAAPTTLKLARQWCVRPELRGDFDWITEQPGAKSCRIRDLLEHLNLASLQRVQFAASLPENEWREFVLSPWIEGAVGAIVWRRELWETIQPRVRRETDAEQAATIVARQLCLRVRFQAEQTMPAEPRHIWLSGVGARKDFDLMYVAGLRSVGIGARLNDMSKCEMFYGGKWQQAPRPFFGTQL
jgi:hypothetical protein